VQAGDSQTLVMFLNGFTDLSWLHCLRLLRRDAVAISKCPQQPFARVSVISLSSCVALRLAALNHRGWFHALRIVRVPQRSSVRKGHSG
jgi:hypothetical protein